VILLQSLKLTTPMGRNAVFFSAYTSPEAFEIASRRTLNNLLVQNAVNNLNPNLTQSRSQKGSDAEKTFKAEGLL